MPPPGRDAAGLRADSPNFGRLRDHRRRLGRKTLDQLAQSGDLDVRPQATWGMPVDLSVKIGDSSIK